MPTSTLQPSPDPPITSFPATRGFDSAQEFSLRVRPCLGHMHRAARKILASEDLAWDAVQETLLRVWTRGWLPPDPLPGLLVLTRQSSLHLQRCGRRRRYHEAVVGAEHEPCCQEDPLLELEAEERQQALRRAVELIPEHLQSVYVRYQYQGHSYASIADELRIPIGTVRSRLNRARTRLSNSLIQRGTPKVSRA